jgi:hypothetical protein
MESSTYTAITNAEEQVRVAEQALVEAKKELLKAKLPHNRIPGAVIKTRELPDCLLYGVVRAEFEGGQVRFYCADGTQPLYRQADGKVRLEHSSCDSGFTVVRIIH